MKPRRPGEPAAQRDWAGVRVVVLGLARQGKALARYLHHAGASVVVSDMKSAKSMRSAQEELRDLSIEYVFGGHPASLLEGADLLCLSGGVPADLPLAQQARTAGIELTNDAQLFLERCPAPVIGITGSAGKTTTTTLVGRMAEAAVQGSDRTAWVGGNIGIPLITDLERIRSDDLVVMELSSFQLELMTLSPHVAGVLNVTPNHLDRHRTMRAYSGAKAHILIFQSEADFAVLGREDPQAWSLREHVTGRLSSFGLGTSFDGEGVFVDSGAFKLRMDGIERRICDLSLVELRGEHNVLNIAAAFALSAAAGIPAEAMEAGVRGFKGVPHRLEFVRTVSGADWYNDSIATAPERAIAALRAFEEPIVLLAGGRDKNLPWVPFARFVLERVDHLILFGEAGEKIAAVVRDQGGASERGMSIDVVGGLEAAVQRAFTLAEEGDVVLLAPGGTSFDEFDDFAQRGEVFRELVEAL